jgi:hypothetical protein
MSVASRQCFVICTKHNRDILNNENEKSLHVQEGIITIDCQTCGDSFIKNDSNSVTWKDMLSKEVIYIKKKIFLHIEYQRYNLVL